jgi:hypothetical protein
VWFLHAECNFLTQCDFDTHKCACWYQTLRSKITLVRVNITLCVWTSHYACEHHNMRVNITICVWTSHFIVNITLYCEHHNMRVNITLLAFENNITLYACKHNITLYVRTLHHTMCVLKICCWPFFFLYIYLKNKRLTPNVRSICDTTDPVAADVEGWGLKNEL